MDKKIAISLAFQLGYLTCEPIQSFSYFNGFGNFNDRALGLKLHSVPLTDIIAQNAFLRAINGRGSRSTYSL
jgi:hypothetical protein